MNINEIEEDEINIRKIVNYLKRNIISILFITFLVTSMAFAYAYFLKPVYSSSVSISFSGQKTSKLSVVISNKTSEVKEDKKSELEAVKLTIQTRKFINSVIKDMPLSERYYIEHRFKKREVYRFENLDIKLNVNNSLYGVFFKIEPVDDKRYRLSCDKLKYSKVHLYNKLVINKEFSIKVSKKGVIENGVYFIKSDDKSLLADNILQNLTINILSDNILQITFNDSVPRRAKEVVEAIAKKFINYTLNKKINEISQTLNFLDTQIAQVKVSLKNKRKMLKKYQEKSNAFMPLESSKLLMESISKKEDELKILNFQYAEVKKFKNALSRNQLNSVALLNSGIDTSSIQNLIELFREETFRLNEMNLQSKNIEKAIIDNEQLTMLINNLNEKKKLLVDLQFSFTEGHPQVIQTRKEISLLETEIHNYIATHIKKLEINKKLTKDKIVDNIKTIEESLKRKIKEFKKEIRKQQSSLEALPEKDLTTQDLKRKFTLSENIYTLLLEKKMEFEISKASIIANTQIIEDAREESTPIKPNKKLILIIGFILGLILGILFSTIRTILDTKIRDSETVEAMTNIPIYGSLPNKANRLFFREALRNIRTNLYFTLPNEKKSITILVSSTVANEGKTTVVASLGEIIAQNNKKVLLIDLDLRKPRLYKKIKKSNEIGITNYLREDKSIEELIQPVTNNLDFIAAGLVPTNPSELLMSNKFDKLITQLKEEYDYILFDTAPIGIVLDTLVILKYSDITLFILEANVSEKSYLENFNRLRLEKDIKHAGIILNKVKFSKNKSYGYEYGYRYGDTPHKDS